MKLINYVGPLNEAKSFHAQLQPVERIGQIAV